MEDRLLHRSLRLGIPLLGTAVVVVLLVFRAEIRVAFRMLGLWAYLATVYRRWPERKLLQDAHCARSNIDVPMPSISMFRCLTGAPSRLDEQRVERELAPEGERV